MKSRKISKAKRNVIRVAVPERFAAVALNRVRPLCHQSLRLVVDPMLLNQLMLSCYQQGLMDGDQVAKSKLHARDIRAMVEGR